MRVELMDGAMSQRLGSTYEQTFSLGQRYRALVLGKSEVWAASGRRRLKSAMIHFHLGWQ